MKHLVIINGGDMEAVQICTRCFGAMWVHDCGRSNPDPTDFRPCCAYADIPTSPCPECNPSGTC